MLIIYGFVLGYGKYDNTVPFEDAESQGVCLAGETQALCFDGETQAVDNVDCTEDLCTQLSDDTEVVADTDDEGTKKIKVLSDTEELSDVDYAKRVDSHTVGTMLQTGLQKQNRGESKEVLISEEYNTGLKNLVNINCLSLIACYVLELYPDNIKYVTRKHACLMLGKK